MVLLDMAMPESLETARAIVRTTPTLKIVALAVPEFERDVVACAQAGVSGYVPREGSLEDLLAVVWSVKRNELLCSPRMAATLFRRAATATDEGFTIPTRDLTLRELQVVRLLDEGLSNKEIAVHLGIEIATVKNHVHNILHKLNVRRRGEAAARVRGRLTHRRALYS